MGQTATKTVRDKQIAQDNLNGMVYREIAKKHGISKSAVCRTLQKADIKAIIDEGTGQMISLIPLAIDTQYKAVTMVDEEGNPTALSLKASENILKTGAIIPSNVTNNTVNQVFNIQNNVTLSAGVAQAMGIALSNDDEDIIDVDPI